MVTFLVFRNPAIDPKCYFLQLSHPWKVTLIMMYVVGPCQILNPSMDHFFPFGSHSLCSLLEFGPLTLCHHISMHYFPSAHFFHFLVNSVHYISIALKLKAVARTKEPFFFFSQRESFKPKKSTTQTIPSWLMWMIFFTRANGGIKQKKKRKKMISILKR